MKNLSMYLTIRMYCMYPVFGCNLMHCMQTTWYSSGHSKRDCLRTNQCYYSLMGHVGELLTRESRRDQYSVLTLTCTDYVVNHQLCFMQYSKFALPFCQHRKFKKKKVCTVFVTVIYGLLQPGMFMCFLRFFGFTLPRVILLTLNVSQSSYWLEIIQGYLFLT